MEGIEQEKIQKVFTFMLFFFLISLKTKIDPNPYLLVVMCQGYIYVKK